MSEIDQAISLISRAVLSKDYQTSEFTSLDECRLYDVPVKNHFSDTESRHKRLDVSKNK
jgi:hypothetical protein